MVATSAKTIASAWNNCPPKAIRCSSQVARRMCFRWLRMGFMQYVSTAKRRLFLFQSSKNYHTVSNILFCYMMSIKRVWMLRQSITNNWRNLALNASFYPFRAIKRTKIYPTISRPEIPVKTSFHYSLNFWTLYTAKQWPYL